MCEKGEKSCPICTEEMDLTDQQLKPCKCGYEICVWCWHHIMEMAEKDGTEGRCPACRTTYDKERVVAMSANCQRMVAEINSQQKKKMHKLKPKSTEGRKHLSDVRVIQRNLVYIIGLPLNLADEDLLQRREYFGRYGKVLKVSISRTSTGVIQHSSNSSCCVYITYSKETEAVRCIQSVHCFVLDGRSLRACFGTTKYCHAWLRNVPCSSRECLYLHDFGSQEDSFTKDELVLAFARSRVPQIIGATNNLHQRSGNVLPPSIDDLRSVNTSSAARPIARSPLAKNEDQIKGSCVFRSSGNTEGFAPVDSWVMRVSGSVSPVPSSCTPGLCNRIHEGSNDHQSIALGATGMGMSNLEARRSAENKDSAELHSSGSLFTSGCSKNDTSLDPYVSEMNDNGDLGLGKSSISTSCSLSSCKGENPATIKSSSGASFLKHSQHLDVCNLEKSGSLNGDDIEGLSSGISSISMHNHIQEIYSVPGSENAFSSYKPLISARGRWPEANKHYSADISNPLASWKDIVLDDLQKVGAEHASSGKSNNTVPTGSVLGFLQSIDRGHSYTSQQNDISYNIIGAECEHILKRSEEDPNMIPTMNQSLQKDFSDYAADYPFVSVQTAGSFNSSVNAEYEEAPRKVNIPVINNNVASDMGESSIISNILSIESDAWEDSLTSPQSLVTLLGESDKPQVSLKVPTIRKVHDKNQSRFSFARQDDFDYETSGVSHHVGDGVIDSSANYTFSTDGVRTNDVKAGKLQPSLSSSNVDSNIFLNVPKGHFSTPPGFSMPSRLPPGFASHLRADQDFGDFAILLQEGHASPTCNIGTVGDFEIFDPTVVKVGQGTLADKQTDRSFDMGRNTFSQLNQYEDNSSLELLAEQSLSQQNFKYTDHIGNKLSSDDAYRVSPRFLDQFHVQPNNSSVYSQLTSQQFNNSHPTNGHLAGWNDFMNFGGHNISDIMSGERMGYNRFVSSYENGKF